VEKPAHRHILKERYCQQTPKNSKPILAALSFQEGNFAVVFL
jgi:hypothetical protein